MKINKDLVDAVMMLSFICLVLVGTTELDNQTTKHIIMGILGFMTLLMVVFRILGSKKHEEKELAD